MEHLYREYATLVAQINDILTISDTVQKNIAQAEKDYQEAVQKDKSKLDEQLLEISEALPRIRAFISIAESRCQAPTPSSKPIPYDNATLSKLGVQINSGSLSSGCADRLYTEATGQLQYLANRQSLLCKQHKENLKQRQDQYSKYIRSEKVRLKSAAQDLHAYLSGRAFASFVSHVKESHSLFADFSRRTTSLSALNGNLAIGRVSCPVPCIDEIKDALSEFSQGLISEDGTIDLPLSVSVNKGSVICAEYENETENNVLAGIQNIIFNIARYYRDSFNRVLFVDPIRYNPSSLGCLAELCGGHGSLIDRVPPNPEEILSVIQSITERLGSANAQSIAKEQKELFIFHGFPHAYSGAEVMLIQQLCANAEYYGIIVVLTTNVSFDQSNKEVMSFLRAQSAVIGVREIIDKDDNQSLPFCWYSSPAVLPEFIREMAAKKTSVVNLDNRYEERVGFQAAPSYKKGVRKIRNIPFGLDRNGQIQTLDFEGHNFATYICGASRSGKSTLLHTLINGFIQNNHPDDIDIWLIDFGMTEFSRYIKHRPPHIRNILLDKSPELVYDIIDRLTTIMNARQRIYSGKWEKLSEVPKEKYFPAIMVVIDEFSVMSHIIWNPSAVGNAGYKEKLEKLLSMGAKLGMYFIFANQSFNGGAKGLTEHAQRQIQQRIAMKTEYAEVKDTLAIKAPSPVDEKLMKELPIHHALIKNKAGSDALSFSHVLYTSDNQFQFRMIDAINENMVARETPAQYDVNRSDEYILKKALIKEGKKYISMGSDIKEMTGIITEAQQSQADAEGLVVFLGEPIRLERVHPTYIYHESGENILLVASQNESAQVASIIKSILFSLDRQNGVQAEIWSEKRNPCYRFLHNCTLVGYETKNELSDICQRISELKQLILQKKRGNQFFVLIGLEAFLFDMSLLDKKEAEKSTATFRKIAPGEADVMTRIARGDAVDTPQGEKPTENSIAMKMPQDYDAREDLKYILTYGPRFGYHFVTHFSSVIDFEQSKLPLTSFVHKIMFGAPKADALRIIGSADAQNVSELEGHSFRYSNGLDRLSFRPYLHKGLSWDGWTYINGKVEQVHDSTEEDCV